MYSYNYRLRCLHSTCALQGSETAGLEEVLIIPIQNQNSDRKTNTAKQVDCKNEVELFVSDFITNLSLVPCATNI